MIFTVIATVIGAGSVLIALLLGIFAVRTSPDPSQDVPQSLALFLGFFGAILLLGVYAGAIGLGLILGLVIAFVCARIFLWDREQRRNQISQSERVNQ